MLLKSTIGETVGIVPIDNGIRLSKGEQEAVRKLFKKIQEDKMSKNEKALAKLSSIEFDLGIAHSELRMNESGWLQIATEASEKLNELLREAR